MALQARVREISPQPKKNIAKWTQNPYFQSCPISHVPVVVCQSVGIRTRGRTAAKGRRTEGRSSHTLRGQHLSQEMPLKVSSLLATVTGSRRRTGAPRSQRGTRLKATTDRAFLVSAGFPPAGANTEEACPSLPGVRAGSFPTNPRQHSSVRVFWPCRASIAQRGRSALIRDHF